MKQFDAGDSISAILISISGVCVSVNTPEIEINMAEMLSPASNCFITGPAQTSLFAATNSSKKLTRNANETTVQ